MGDVFFATIVVPLQNLLTIFYDFLCGLGIENYGVAIILLTIAIKMVLFPFTYKALRSMKAMQTLQPKMQELQKKYKNDSQRLNMEMAKLYKEEGINPLAGCLPMLLQMPFLIGIFYAIRDFQYIAPPNFLWIQNLAEADHTYVLPVLSAVTTYIQQKQTTSMDNPQAKIMLAFMPLMIGYMSINFSGGLVLYWVVGNLFQICQQWLMNRNMVISEKGAS